MSKYTLLRMFTYGIKFFIIIPIIIVPPSIELSLNGTVLTASWDELTFQDVSYTLTCSVDSKEVLFLNTTLTEVTVGVYMLNTTYSCNVYATISGEDETATEDKDFTTGGNTVSICDECLLI